MKKEIRRLFGRDILVESYSVVNDIHASVQEIKDKIAYLEEYCNALNENINSLNEELRNISNNTKEYISLENSFLSKKNGKKNILICGFFGARNLGDELMLQALLSTLDKSKFNITILLSNNYSLDASIYSPYGVIHYPKRSSDIISFAHKYDAVLWCGGALMDDEDYCFNGEYSSISYLIMKITKVIVDSGGKFFSFSVSSNKELTNRLFLDDLKYLIDKSSFFSVRDEYTKESLKKAGIDIGGIKLMDDLVFLNYLNSDNKGIETRKDGKRTLGINLIFDNNDGEIKYYSYLIKEILASKKYEKVVFIPFYDYNSTDVKNYKELIDLLIKEKHNSCQFEICDFAESYDKIKSTFLSCEDVVVMRYHAIVIGLMTGSNMAVVDYSGKHRHYFNKISFIKKKYAENLSLYEYDKKIDKTNRIIFKKTIIADSLLKSICKNNHVIIDNTINKLGDKNK